MLRTEPHTAIEASPSRAAVRSTARKNAPAFVLNGCSSRADWAHSRTQLTHP